MSYLYSLPLARPPLARPSSSDELDQIYDRFLEKDHSHRTKKYMLESFEQFDLPVPEGLHRMQRQLQLM